MKLKVLKCPDCGANIRIEEGRNSCFCSYCGCNIFFDDEKHETTINKNINITKNIDKTNRYIDVAELERIRASEQSDKADRRSGCFAILLFGFIAFILLGIWWHFESASEVAKSQGKISAGYYRDLIGENYKSVKAHFEAAGFTNITLIDLDDSGIAFWTEDEVESISIGGDTSFESHDYFDPDTKVVISYH